MPRSAFTFSRAHQPLASLAAVVVPNALFCHPLALYHAGRDAALKDAGQKHWVTFCFQCCNQHFFTLNVVSKGGFVVVRSLCRATPFTQCSRGT